MLRPSKKHLTHWSPTDDRCAVRIAFLTERARGSGAAEAAWNLAAHLQDAGHDVGYFYAESSGPAQAEFRGAQEIGRWQGPNREIREMKGGTPGTRPWLDAHLRRRTMLVDLRRSAVEEVGIFGPDVVHLHNIAAIGGHLLASTMLRRWPTVWTAHDRYPFELFHNRWEMNGETVTTWEYSPASRPARTALEMFKALPLSMEFICPSQWIADIAVARLGERVHRVSVVPNLIPTVPSSEELTINRLADELNVDAVALAAIPNTRYPLKGYDVVRAAIEQANSLLGKRRIALAVTTDKPLGLQDDGIYATPELFERGLIGQSGYLDKASMTALYRAVDVVMIGSWIENMPNVAIEAAAAGRPVIATAVGGIPEVVRSGETGWLVPAGDAQAMARALVEAADPDRRAALGGAARLEYERRNHPDVVASRHIHLYRRSIEKWAGDPRSVICPGVDFTESKFAPPTVPETPRPPALRRYIRAAVRRMPAAVRRLQRWGRRQLSRVA